MSGCLEAADWVLEATPLRGLIPKNAAETGGGGAERNLPRGWT